MFDWTVIHIGKQRGTNEWNRMICSEGLHINWQNVKVHLTSDTSVIFILCCIVIIMLWYLRIIALQIIYQQWAETMFTTGLIMSILSTLAIAVHRFIIVRFDPLGNRKIVTPCRSISVCVIGWVIVATVYTVAFYLEGEDPVISRIGSTVAIWVCLVITLLCYGFVYCRIACASWYSARLEALTQGGIGVHKRILFTFSLVFGSTFICWIPISLILLLEGLGVWEDEEWVSIFSDVAFNLLCLIQVINPILYWTGLTAFRNQLCCCGRSLPEDEQEMTIDVSPNWPGPWRQ